MENLRNVSAFCEEGGDKTQPYAFSMRFGKTLHTLAAASPEERLAWLRYIHSWAPQAYTGGLSLAAPTSTGGAAPSNAPAEGKGDLPPGTVHVQLAQQALTAFPPSVLALKRVETIDLSENKVRGLSTLHKVIYVADRCAP